jgi:hypothetical protein
MTLLDTTPEPQSMRELADNLWNDLVFISSYYTFHSCGDRPGYYVGYKAYNERETYVAFRITERRNPLGKHTGWKVTEYDFDNRTSDVVAESYHAHRSRPSSGRCAKSSPARLTEPLRS